METCRELQHLHTTGMNFDDGRDRFPRAQNLGTLPAHQTHCRRLQAFRARFLKPRGLDQARRLKCCPRHTSIHRRMARLRRVPMNQPLPTTLIKYHLMTMAMAIIPDNKRKIYLPTKRLTIIHFDMQIRFFIMSSANEVKLKNKLQETLNYQALLNITII